MQFEWDGEKAQSNVAKHGVSFEEAAEVFFDPFYRSGDATHESMGEAREFVLGYAASRRLILVVYTDRSPKVRIISARIATRVERKQYESF